MKNIVFLYLFILNIFGLWGQQFSIPAGAELLESTEFKHNGIPYIIEQRYRLRSGEILYAYYDVEGQSSITIQRIEQTPILALGTEINISGMPGYREFNFGNDNRKLVQFLKLMKLGWQQNYGRNGGIRTPSLSDRVFNGVASWRSEFILLLDLLDETWTLEHRQYSGRNLASSDTTAFYRVSAFNDTR
jgi:hypothetical protein